MARASLLFDPLNRISIDAIISPKHIGERELAARHFLNLLPEDLVLLDRGYPAYWLFNLILSLQTNFCARISNKKWKIVRKFFNSGKQEKIISLPAYWTSIKKCQQIGLDLKPFIEQADRNRNYSYQVNFARALVSVKNTIVLLFNRPMETVNRLLHDLLELLSMTVEPVRPGRSYPRNHKKRKNIYLNYKPVG